MIERVVLAIGGGLAERVKDVQMWAAFFCYWMDSRGIPSREEGK